MQTRRGSHLAPSWSAATTWSRQGNSARPSTSMTGSSRTVCAIPPGAICPQRMAAWSSWGCPEPRGPGHYTPDEIARLQRYFNHITRAILVQDEILGQDRSSRTTIWSPRPSGLTSAEIRLVEGLVPELARCGAWRKATTGLSTPCARSCARSSARPGRAAKPSFWASFMASQMALKTPRPILPAIPERGTLVHLDDWRAGTGRRHFLLWTNDVPTER